MSGKDFIRFMMASHRRSEIRAKERAKERAKQEEAGKRFRRVMSFAAVTIVANAIVQAWIALRH